MTITCRPYILKTEKAGKNIAITNSDSLVGSVPTIQVSGGKRVKLKPD